MHSLQMTNIWSNIVFINPLLYVTAKIDYPKWKWMHEKSQNNSYLIKSLVNVSAIKQNFNSNFDHIFHMHVHV